MTLCFNGNDFKYEMENVARLFFPLRRFSYIYGGELPEKDFLAFIRREVSEGGELEVRIQDENFAETAISFVKQGPQYENRCEMEFARMLYRLLQKDTGITPKWGVLTGIRPVKRLQIDMESGKSRQEAMAEMTEGCLVSEEKAHLAMQICEIQKEILADSNRMISAFTCQFHIALPGAATARSFPIPLIIRRQKSYCRIIWILL